MLGGLPQNKRYENRSMESLEVDNPLKIMLIDPKPTVPLCRWILHEQLSPSCLGCVCTPL